MISGLLPVGKPRTNGFSGVGSKALMRSTVHRKYRVKTLSLRLHGRKTRHDGLREGRDSGMLVERPGHTDNIVCYICRRSLGIFTDDEPPSGDWVSTSHTASPRKSLHGDGAVEGGLGVRMQQDGWGQK